MAAQVNQPRARTTSSWTTNIHHSSKAARKKSNVLHFSEKNLKTDETGEKMMSQKMENC